MTGRGAGFCSGSNVPGFTNAATGRFFRRGSGRGQGGGYRFFNRNLGDWMRDSWPRFFTERSHNPADEIEQIKEEIDSLEKAISGMKSRVEELKSGN
jgi:ubiquinone biosynthesis protein UbiJ